MTESEAPSAHPSPFAVERDRRWEEASRICLAYERRLAELRNLLGLALNEVERLERELRSAQG